MYAVTQAFKDAVRHGEHEAWVVEADVTLRGAVVASGMPVIFGDVDIDRNAKVRRRLTCTIAPEEDIWVPGSSLDPLFPTGNEVTIRAGFRYANGTTELVPQGVFRISRPKVRDTGDQFIVQVDGYDRSRAVSRARFTAPYVITAGTLYTTAIKNVILRAFPWFTDANFVFMSSSLTTPELVFESDDDPWIACLDMASSLGAEVFFDGTGRGVLRPEPDPSNSPVVWEYHEGEQANFTDVDKDLDDEQAYNGVIAIGESTMSGVTPVRAEVWDLDPQSPTYYDPSVPHLSNYGPVPYFFQSPFIVTQQQANDAAAGNLRRVIGVLEQVAFSATPNPAHEEGDLVSVLRARAKVDTTNILDAFRMPLTLGGIFSGTTRKRRVL